MTTAAVLPAPPEMAFAVRWTRAECEKMDAAGLLRFRYELINGLIIRCPPRLLREAMTASQIVLSLQTNWSYDYLITLCGMTVAPDENDYTCPAPDVLVLNKSGRAIPGDYARPEDIHFLVEVSDTTLDYDLTTKAGVYARAGIAQYFVIDVTGRVVYDHRLTGSGAYARDVYKSGDGLTLVCAPELALRVDDWLLPNTNLNT